VNAAVLRAPIGKKLAIGARHLLPMHDGLGGRIDTTDDPILMLVKAMSAFWSEDTDLCVDKAS
jgi:hypothetical protein